MVDRRVLPLFPGGGAAYGAKAGICPDRSRYFSQAENMPGLRKGLPSGHKPGVLLRLLPQLCQTKIRAGTETAQAAKQGVMCPQLSPIRPVFSRVLRPCLRGAYIRILPASEIGGSCGQRALPRRSVFMTVWRDAYRKNTDCAGDHADRYQDAGH